MAEQTNDPSGGRPNVLIIGGLGLWIYDQHFAKKKKKKKKKEDASS
jgi:hypothetical protein